jgi:hypothetical protein
MLDDLKKKPKLKGEIYFIDLKEKIIKRKKMFTHSRDMVIKREKIKCPPPSYVWM